MRIDLPYIDDETLGDAFEQIKRDHSMKNWSEPHVIFVLPGKAKRSLRQNAYYWGVVLEDIADQTGFWPDEIHDFNKKNFGIKTMYFIDGEAAELIKGLRKMGSQKATEFINRVIEHWSSKGIIIREPNQLTQEEILQATIADTEQDD